MKDRMYLYGTENIPEIPKATREGRLFILKSHLGALLTEPGAVGTIRVNDVVKAISFWTNLK